MFSEIFKDLPPGKRFQWGNPSGAYEGRGVPISKLLEPSNHGVRRWHLLRKTTTISNKRSRVKKKKTWKKNIIYLQLFFFVFCYLSFSLCVRFEKSTARGCIRGVALDAIDMRLDRIGFFFTFTVFLLLLFFFFCWTPFGEIQTAVENCKR